ncbi:MAG: flagellar biosynthetic protein FliO [Hydrogenophaga sp.]|uniref:flagellar biosynthetic protein FliO n=1 Tax=Hydrogenophaga sp. TaxID=1904254 RepID=UPI00260D6E1E|nr:flagellar biosynthetic protein FliO [Hydrogenophaga sp.]MDM7942416.1 flagellar biosynthetic protein FliO [Hydrogenophaga sp.]
MSAGAGYGSAALLLLMLVVLALWLIWRRPRGGGGGLRSKAAIRTLEAAALGGRDRLLLVECDGRRYLLSQGVQGVQLIDRLEPARPEATPSAGVVGS